MAMRSIHVRPDDRFALGVDEETGRAFLSIPVSNSFVDYQEWYWIDQSLLDLYPQNVQELQALANKCRRRENDEHLVLKPGSKRGSADQIVYE